MTETWPKCLQRLLCCVFTSFLWLRQFTSFLELTLSVWHMEFYCSGMLNGSETRSGLVSCIKNAFQRLLINHITKNQLTENQHTHKNHIPHKAFLSMKFVRCNKNSFVKNNLVKRFFYFLFLFLFETVRTTDNRHGCFKRFCCYAISI